MSEALRGRRVTVYDTTLRDGSQGEGISFSVADKVRIARKLDELGVDYVEGGWPGSNPKDIEFFEVMSQEPLRHARLAAFGSTCRPDASADEDPMLLELVASQAQAVALFGKSSDFHVTHSLRTSLAQNLKMISTSIAMLVRRVPEVIFDAEHFFDGHRANPDYALACLKAAEEAGASTIVLCDTNGGSLPDEVEAATAAARAVVSAPLGIHTHDDGGCAVANAWMGVRAGADHVQGTINGYGERCGNANLCTIIPLLALKAGCDLLRPGSLEHLTGVSQFVDEVANLTPNHRLPFVGRSAFAHKAGMHVDAVTKHRATFEHVDPRSVGNTRRILVSELSGGATIASKAMLRALDVSKGSPEARGLLRRVAHLEREGYSFEGAEASFELLMMDSAGVLHPKFDIEGFRVIVEKRGKEAPTTEATVKLRVNGEQRLTVAEGDGPVHALDRALRKALRRFYPEVERIRLTDFKVRVVNVREATAARVRTMVESRSGDRTWATVGVSTNMIEASWQALVDSIVYSLIEADTIGGGNADCASPPDTPA